MPNYTYKANLFYKKDGRLSGVKDVFAIQAYGTKALDALVADLKKRHVRSGETPEVKVFAMNLVSSK